MNVGEANWDYMELILILFYVKLIALAGMNE